MDMAGSHTGAAIPPEIRTAYHGGITLFYGTSSYSHNFSYFCTAVALPRRFSDSQTLPCFLTLTRYGI